MREPCALCSGTGVIEDIDRDHPSIPCLACNCTGETPPVEDRTGLVPCAACHGTGIETDPEGIRYVCGNCGGRKYVTPTGERP